MAASERNPRGGTTGVRLRITSVYSWGEHEHNMRHDDIYRALGLDPKKHLPDEGIEGVINGVQVYVLPKNDPRRIRYWKSRYPAGHVLSGLRGKRTFAICTCGRHVEAGHLHQHVCKY